MARKATIIKCLNKMGYLVAQDGPIVGISLRTKEGVVFIHFVLEEQLEFDDFIVENIVAEMNRIIVGKLYRR